MRFWRMPARLCDKEILTPLFISLLLLHFVNAFSIGPALYSDAGFLPSAELANELASADISFVGNGSLSREVHLYHADVWQNVADAGDRFSFQARVNKSLLVVVGGGHTVKVPVSFEYVSPTSLVLSYDTLYSSILELSGPPEWYWLPKTEPDTARLVIIYLDMVAHNFGRGTIRFWVKPAKVLLSADRSQEHTMVKGFQLTENCISAGVGSISRPNPCFLEYTSLLDPKLGDNPDWRPSFTLPFTVLMYKGVLAIIFRSVLIVLLVMLTFTMGCELDPRIIWEIIKKPFGPLIGLCCQFLLNPLLALAIGKAIPITPELAFGLITIGSSPGGGGSNLWSMVLGGDLNLSMTMTAISCTSALGLMPLLLFIFGRFFIDVNRVVVPYGTIVVQLLALVVPCSLGILFRYWKPKFAFRLTRLTGPLALIFILTIITLGTASSIEIYKLMAACPIVIACGCLLPWCGFFMAGLIAYILRQPWSSALTIGIETGIQNIGIAILVLMYSMPQPEGDIGALMVITVAVFTPIPLYVAAIFLSIKRRHCIFIRKKTDPYVAEMEVTTKSKTVQAPVPV